MTALSVITPTIGRESLRTMLQALLPQFGPGDEVLVVGDGPQPRAREIVASFPKTRPAGPIFYLEQGPIRNYGNPQRNMAATLAVGNYLVFIDDDDVPLPNCLDAIRRAASEVPGRPFMFRMYHGQMVLWKDMAVRGGNVSGQMFVPPNLPGRVGRWSGRYAADFDFINSTLALYPGGHADLVWRKEILVRQGWAGPTAEAREL